MALRRQRKGRPKGGRCHPCLANLLLDGFDKELERRGHRFVRYADDSNIYVKSAPSRSARPGQCDTVLRATTEADGQCGQKCGGPPLAPDVSGLHVHEASAPPPPGECQSPEGAQTGNTSTDGPDTRRLTAASRAGPATVPRGVACVLSPRRRQSPFKERDSWVRRRLRGYVWKQWGRHRYRELRQPRGESGLAWNTCKSAHGPWRLSRSPALAIALPGHYFDRLGVPRLHRRSRR